MIPRDAPLKPSVIIRHGGSNFKAVPSVHGCMGCEASGFGELCNKCKPDEIFKEVEK